MQRFYANTYSSFPKLLALFKADPESSTSEFEAWHPSLREDILDVVHDALSRMPQTIHKTVLKSIIIALLQDKELKPADEVRALFVLIQNPVFAAQSSYTVFAHLLRHIVNLSNVHKQHIIQWFRGMEAEKLRKIVRNTIQFINVKQFPPSSRHHLLSNSSSRWWIPTAAKALALINASNELSTPSTCFLSSDALSDPTLSPPPPLHYTDLYNTALDHLDLMNDFSTWQSNTQSHPGQFSYCQYPFLLSIVAKRTILTKDSEQQMIQTARRSIEAKGPFYRYRYRYQPQMDLFFLNIRIRRSHLVSDSLNEIATKQQDLKKKLKVSFVGEPGLDMGGLAKEWLLLLIRYIFEPDYGMFVYHSNSRCYWFSTSAGCINGKTRAVEKKEGTRKRRGSGYSNSSSSSSGEDSPQPRSRPGSYQSHIISQSKNLREYNLIGVLMGLAVYNSITLDLHFPSICYRKLLSPPVAPWGSTAEAEAEDEHEELVYGTDEDTSDEENTEYNASDDDSVMQDQRKLISSVILSEQSHVRNSGINSSRIDKVGLVEAPSIEALAEIMPDVARGLSELLAYEGNVEEDMCMNFQVSLEEYGEVRTYDMKERGADIPVTNENRHEYVALYLDWVLNSAIYHQFRAFYLGFHCVCDSNALLLLRPEEVEMLVCGSPTIDLHELQKVTEYDGYNEDDPVIRRSLRDVHRTGNFSPMQRFYANTYSSFPKLLALFKADPESSTSEFEAWHPSLREDILDVVHDALSRMPQTIHKTVLKSIIIALLQDKELTPADEVRALFVLIQNPVFAAQSSYTVFAHLLRHIVNLSNVHKQHIIQWFRGMEAEKLRKIIRNTIQFINVKQFPPSSRHHLLSNSSSRWWIPTAAKALALINASNELSTPSTCFLSSDALSDPTLSPPPPLHYTDLYNTALDHLDLMNDFSTWQSNTQSHPGQFSYCQYPFLLSIVAKRTILTKDSEQQMIQTARRSIEAKGPFYRYRYRYQPQMDLFFLNIRIRRSHLVSDSLNEIATKQQDLKKKLKVSFVGEPGLDMGGLAKEWLLLLIRYIFEPDYGMFVYHSNSRCYWFSTSAGCINGKTRAVEKKEGTRKRRGSGYSNSSSSSSGEDSPQPRSRPGSYQSHIISQSKNLREYNLIGVLMGLAVYNSITLDLHFPSICYRKLLSPPVAPWGSTAEAEAEDEHEELVYGTDEDTSDEENTEYNASDDDSVMQDQRKLISSVILSEQSHVRNSGINSSRIDKVGLVEAPSIEALAEIMPDVARLSELLAYEGNVEEDMCMNFQVSLEEYGEVRTYDMKERGADIPVTNENRHEYVALYLDWVLNSAIYHQFRAFYLGFHCVCDSNALLLLRPEEVEMLVCGSPTIDLHELQKVTEYDGYNEDDPVIRDFWEVLESLPLDLQKKFLHFTTGSDRVPVGGMSEMPFKITKLPPIPNRGFNRMRRRIGGTRGNKQSEAWESDEQEEQLPEAHTCFNQLVLPPYRNQETLRQKLIIAISNAEGFGLE